MKKKKPGKYLKFYMKCMETGSLPENWDDIIAPVGGLCSVFYHDRLFKLFSPYPWGWVGEGYVFADDCADRIFGFGGERQNVVLFMAAMNNEL
jgi:hypothetical protein